MVPLDDVFYHFTQIRIGKTRTIKKLRTSAINLPRKLRYLE